jgi:multidrug efflux pump subunit AcrA (membrane-fusion protein)
MNSFLVPIGIAVAALAASLHHRNAARHAAADQARLRAEQATAVTTLAGVQARIDNTAKNLAEASRELTAARAELRTASEAALQARVEPDPATEGAWPSNRPYFYLPKHILSDIGFAVLTSDGEPTTECLALLGMTPSEQADLRQAWADLRFQLQELQLRSAERIPEANPEADPNRRAVRFRLSSLTNEIPILRDQLQSSLTKSLGSTRAQLLQPDLEERLRELNGPYSDLDLVVTYRAERAAEGDVHHFLQFEAGDSRRTQLFVGTLHAKPEKKGDDGLTFPIGPQSPLWNYRHLFGDQPLFSPP